MNVWKLLGDIADKREGRFSFLAVYVTTEIMHAANQEFAEFIIAAGRLLDQVNDVKSTHLWLTGIVAKGVACKHAQVYNVILLAHSCKPPSLNLSVK